MSARFGRHTASAHGLFNPYARARHARYIDTGVSYHIISRTRGNLFLLRPDAHGRLRRIVAGILAQARRNYPSIVNFAVVVLANHLHALLQVRYGYPRVLADYVAFFTRELTRRGKHKTSPIVLIHAKPNAAEHLFKLSFAIEETWAAFARANLAFCKETVVLLSLT